MEERDGVTDYYEAAKKRGQKLAREINRNRKKRERGEGNSVGEREDEGGGRRVREGGME